MRDKRGWRLVDQLEVEGNEYDGDMAPPANVKSADWFNPTFEPEASRPATVTLAEAWQEYMSYMSHGYGGPWLSQLEHEFGEGISPEMASSLMSVFVWFGTNAGYGTLHQSFHGITVSDEYINSSRWTTSLYGYWAKEFFGHYSKQQGTAWRLKSLMASEFTADHFDYFIALLDFLLTTRGARLVNEALVAGKKGVAIKIRTPTTIWTTTLTEKNTDGSPKTVYALEKRTLTTRFKPRQRSVPPKEILAYTSLDGRYYLEEREITLI